MTDLYELKAALLAAREHSDLPVIASMTFEQNLRTFMGCDAVCYALTASPLADAIGVNCSLGPRNFCPSRKRFWSLPTSPSSCRQTRDFPTRREITT